MFLRIANLNFIILNIISTEAQGTLICGGDFNTILNSKIDTSKVTERYVTHIARKHKPLLRNLGPLERFFSQKNEIIPITPTHIQNTQE